MTSTLLLKLKGLEHALSTPSQIPKTNKMPINPNASPKEMTSPFYTKNKVFCVEVEKFITAKNGEVEGTYNAWSYDVSGTIPAPKGWTLKYKKATFSSGNILLSSKFQNLLVMAQWEIKTLTEKSHSRFLIRKKTNSDSLKRLFNKSLSKFDLSDKYVLRADIKSSALMDDLKTILEPLFKSGEIYKIEYQNDQLKIELRTEKHHFDIFNQLLVLEL